MKRIILAVICFYLILAYAICYADSKLISEKPTEDNKTILMVDIAPHAENYSSPEETWNHFKNALMNGNYESANDCYSNAQTRKTNIFKKMGNSRTRNIIKQMKPLEKIYQETNKAKYLIVRNMQGIEISAYVYFARINNDWKIEMY